MFTLLSQVTPKDVEALAKPEFLEAAVRQMPTLPGVTENYTSELVEESVSNTNYSFSTLDIMLNFILAMRNLGTLIRRDCLQAITYKRLHSFDHRFKLAANLMKIKK